MHKQTITVELDEDTIRQLAAVGNPADIIAHLAASAAEGVSRAGDHPLRDRTDESLGIERDKADEGLSARRKTEERAADDVVRVARERADEVLQIARDHADRESGRRSTATEAGSVKARAVLEHERSNADAVIEEQRAGRKRKQSEFLEVERDSTDKHLSGERIQLDRLIVDQREANQSMVSAAIRANEAAIEAEASRERAEESERALRATAEFREQFIGIVSHDLRNPLTSIGGSAAMLLRRGHLDEQDAATVARIIRSSQRMGRMISQLLDLTRTRLGGGMPIHRKATDLGALCRNVADEFDATIQLEVEGDVTGHWDPDRLEEVLSNLTGNAIEYSTPGTDVIIKAHAEGTDAVVEVCNQGDPIPADVLPFIFEPFRRAKQREKATMGNLGLGLYIAQQIVLAHGGTLEAQCADGITRFVMRIPRSAPVEGA